MNNGRSSPWLGFLVVFLFALSGCDGGSTLSLIGWSLYDDPASLDGITLEVSGNGRSFVVTRPDFRSTETNATPHTREYPVSDRGTLRVHAILAEGADTLAAGEIALELRPNFKWSVGVSRTDKDPGPEGGCYKCWGSTRFEIPESQRRTPNEALWLTWSGASSSD